MTGAEVLQLLVQLPFVFIFVVVLAEFVRRPSKTNGDIAAYFGAFAAIVIMSWVFDLLEEEPHELLAFALVVLLVALPCLLLRVVNDFAGVRPWVMRAAEAGLLLSAIVLFVQRDAEALPLPLVELIVAYFVAIEVYVAVRFVREARRTQAVTRRRMRAAAIGSALLGLVLLFGGLAAAIPNLEDVWSVLSSAAAAGSALAYLVAFATPSLLRRAWQLPHVRRFLVDVSDTHLHGDLVSLAAAIEDEAMRTTGAEGAALLLWNEEAQYLFSPRTGDIAPRGVVSEQALHRQQVLAFDDPGATDPEHADLYNEYEARVIIAAPVTASDRRLGVLVIYSAYPPIFQHEEVEVLEMVAGQAALILEVRAFAEETAALAAREEATQLKEEFLSAAAHDLRTPLTTLVGQAQLMQRRLRRDPEAPTDAEGVERLVSQAERMRELVNDLLDATRADQVAFVEVFEPVDLDEIVRSEASRIVSDRHEVVIDSEGGAVVEGDPARLRQLLQNLLDNAVKYSPAGGTVQVEVRPNAAEVRLTVRDEGVGISPAQMSHLFERFWRASTTDSRRATGMGLGLYICRRIVEGHGGRIWAESRGSGFGSAFRVALPVRHEEESA